MHTNNSFIQGQENMKFLVKANSNKEYNDYLFNQVNIKDVKLVSLLNILSPFIYLINVTVTFVFILFKFLSSLFSYRWKVNKNEYENFDELYSSIAICCGAFVMSFWLKIHPIIIVILSAIVGYLIYGL